MHAPIRKVVVIGGGISGLAAAYYLNEFSRDSGSPLEITLLEAGNRFGGVIETRFQDGFLLEGGPDAFISEKPWALELCRRLGLENELIPTNRENARSFIFHRGRLLEVPAGFYLIAPTRFKTLLEMPFMSGWGKLRMLLEIFIPPGPDREDESVGSFIRHRFGREALERIGQPMIGGIYTADPERLSLEATFPRFREMVRNHGSVLRGIRRERAIKNEACGQASGPRYSLFYSLKGGMGRLAETLMEKMPEVHFRSSARVMGLDRREAWKIRLASGEEMEADAVSLALPAFHSAALIRSSAPEVAEELNRISYESVATVNLGYRREDIPHPLNGFGFVVPAVEKMPIIGCTFASVKFSGRAPDRAVLLRVFLGGAAQRDVLGLDDGELSRRAGEALSGILKIEKEPLFVSVHRYPQAMPQYEVGHLARVASIRRNLSRYPGLFLAGNAFHGVGIPDCIRQAEQIAGQILSNIQLPPASRVAAGTGAHTGDGFEGGERATIQMKGAPGSQ